MRNEFEKIIRSAFAEDSVKNDITSENIIPKKMKGTAWLSVQEPCIICGLQSIRTAYDLLKGVKVSLVKADGDRCRKGEPIAKLEGSVKNILMGERTVLNILQFLSGIATETNELVKLAKGVPVFDTRKTIPGWRALSKYAVKKGGGQNHRSALSGHVLIKSTHIRAAGGIDSALERLFAGNPKRPIEIEVTNLKELKTALSYPIDIVLLDNMDLNTAKEAVDLCKGKVLTEISGGINKLNISNYAELKPGRISCGSITHSARAVSIHLEPAF